MMSDRILEQLKMNNKLVQKTGHSRYVCLEKDELVGSNIVQTNEEPLTLPVMKFGKEQQTNKVTQTTGKAETPLVMASMKFGKSQTTSKKPTASKVEQPLAIAEMVF